MKKVLLIVVLTIAFVAIVVPFRKCPKKTFKPIPLYECDNHPQRKSLSIESARRIARNSAKRAGLWSPDNMIDYHALIDSRDEPDHIHVYWHDSSRAILAVSAFGYTFYMTPEQAIATEWPNESFIEEYINLVKDEGIVPEPVPVIMPY